MSESTTRADVFAWLSRRPSREFFTPSRVATGVGIGTDIVREALNELVAEDALVFRGNGANRRFRVRTDSDLRTLTVEQLREMHTLDVADLYDYGFEFDSDSHDAAWEVLQERARDGEDAALEFVGEENVED